MNTQYKREELFIDCNLPEPLPEEEIRELFIKVNNGERSAYNKIIIHNIRLVISRVFGRFYTLECEKEDLISIGNIGLMNAVNSFDMSKNIKFNSYAVRCIDNEILLYLKGFKRHQYVESIDEPLIYLKDDELTYKDCIKDDIDLEEKYLDKELYSCLNKILLDLPEIDKEIIMMFYGFNNSKLCTQKEIGERFNFSQSYASRKIIDSLKRIKKTLEDNGLIEKKKIKTLKK